MDYKHFHLLFRVGKYVLPVLAIAGLIVGLVEARKYQDQYSDEAQQARYRAAMTPEQRAEVDSAKALVEDRKLAQLACQQFVKRSLHDPEGSELGLAETFLATREGNGTWVVIVTGRARNGFDALRELTASCKVSRQGGNTQLISLTEIR